MKKYIVILLVIGLCMSLSACNTKEIEQNNQLQGYYLNPLNGERYCFEITEYGSGDYGGTLTDLTNTTNVSVWSVKGTTVYINGEATYTYDGNVLYKKSDIFTLLQVDNNSITGSFPLYDEQFQRGNFSAYNDDDEHMCYYHADGTVELYMYNHSLLLGKTTYTIEDCIVSVSDIDNPYGGGVYPTEAIWYLYNNQLFWDILIPV